MTGRYFAAPHMAPAATGHMKMAELFLIECTLSRLAPVEPAAEICHDSAFIIHRPRGVTLAAEKRSKSLNVKCQRANAGPLASRHCSIIPIGHRPSPQSRGKASVRDDSRIMPRHQRAAVIQVLEVERISGG